MSFLKTTPSFTVFDAAAGSGKTFTLVKEYIKLLLLSPQDDYYKHLLAITFTNKAVGEMKQRIVSSLVLFSEVTSTAEPPAMLKDLKTETGLSYTQIQLRAKAILKHLLHHFAGFSVETIDSFNHRLIRTFARDLKIASNFEVSLDQQELLAEAVDRLINEAGNDTEITRLLVDFALSKTDDDKSWDISRDIATASELLFSENDMKAVAKLKERTITDFSALKIHLLKKQKSLSEKIKETALKTLTLIEESGLQFEDFHGKYLPNYFVKLSNSGDVKYGAQWQENIGEKPLYPARVLKESPHAVDTIESLTPVFKVSFEETKKDYFDLALVNSALKNLTPLSVINLVHTQLQDIKEERNVVLISEFNALINKEIKDQPAPFIYERLGEKYRHFFIDEFQDTSLLQWHNLIPLIDNALSQEHPSGQQGSLLLVGDAKQSIYRWRGGLPEQFMDLYGEGNPFLVSEKKIASLKTNWRSCKKIVEFNNSFFSYVSKHLGDPLHKTLYTEGSKQLQNSKEGGFVRFEFIEPENKAEAHTLYAQKIYETIGNLQEKGYAPGDICILTRKKDDGIAIGAFLMEHGISVVSSETLLLKHSPVVTCITNTLLLSVSPNNEEAMVNILDFLYDHLEITKEKHVYFSEFLNSPVENLSDRFSDLGISFNLRKLQSLSLYESCEYIIKQFCLTQKADAYVTGFMDLIFDFLHQPLTGKLNFLDYWETKKDSAAIALGEEVDAVRLMTIHKAKGLEFPVVLFPYADQNIYFEKNAKTWFPLPEEIAGFDETLINFNESVNEFGANGMAIYNERRTTQELDNMNLLYVTFTRAIEQLYVFAEKKSEPKDGDLNTFNHFFIDYLKHSQLWDDTQTVYEFGESGCLQNFKKKERPDKVVPQYRTSFPETHQLKIVSSEALLWETEAGQAITRGNLFHDTMAGIRRREDAEKVFELLENARKHSPAALEALRKTIGLILEHPELTTLYSSDDRIENERDIITAAGMVLRPDRLNIHSDGSVTITDYKTGGENLQHRAQLMEYAAALEDMGFHIQKMLIIYVSENRIVINKI